MDEVRSLLVKITAIQGVTDWDAGKDWHDACMSRIHELAWEAIDELDDIEKRKANLGTRAQS